MRFNALAYRDTEAHAAALLSSASGNYADEDDDDEVLDICCCPSTSADDNAEDDDEKQPLCLVGCCSSSLGRMTIFAVCVVVFYLLYSSFSTTSAASNSAQPTPSNFNATKANTIIRTLCDDYSKGQVSGDLCLPLCGAANWTLLDFYEGGSKNVLKLSMDGKDTILKMDQQFSRQYEQIDARVSEEEFSEKAVEIVNDQLHMGWPERYRKHLLRQLWPAYKADKTLSDADKRSIWYLLQQEEFINFRLLHPSRVTPKVFRTCGHVYEVEYLIPFRMKGYYMNLKAKILVHLMGTLKLFYEFLNEPLQWCDVKFENLGLSASYPKRFVVMDGDMLYTESKLRDMLTTKKCVTDNECNFFDCESRCDNTTGFCTDRLNDNIDVFCKKLVTRLFGTFWTKSNRYLAACHEQPLDRAKRLADLRLVWAWSFSDI
ncbi:Protein C53D5.1 d [Aphelenchoides avenae]|nr:Protein C53D5.1 d [Aphelenchus avenae]